MYERFDAWNNGRSELINIREFQSYYASTKKVKTPENTRVIPMANTPDPIIGMIQWTEENLLIIRELLGGQRDLCRTVSSRTKIARSLQVELLLQLFGMISLGN
jgi:hypothetical protein